MKISQKFTNVLLTSVAAVSLALGIGLSLTNAHSRGDEVKAYSAQNLTTLYADCEAAVANGSVSNLWSAVKVAANSNKHVGSYNDLWTRYKTTDVDASGRIVDWYGASAQTNPVGRYIAGSDQCGTYSVEGDCYNREHSIPKSWWGGAESNQGADLYIVVPTDGKVNGMRSNYAFGEVGSATYTSQYGHKLGSSNFSGKSGTVFEPIDDWKGDFARNYFYARAAWDSVSMTSGDGSAIFSGTNGSSSNGYGLTTYGKNLLISWNKLDPVSAFELERNNRGESVQGNRNPFIDHPEYANYIWGGDPMTPAKEVTNLAVSGTPNKTTYLTTDNFVATGLTVTATYIDHSTENVTSKVSWGKPQLNGTVVGTYMGVSVTVSGLTVSDPVVPPVSEHGTTKEDAFSVTEAIAHIEAKDLNSSTTYYVKGLLQKSSDITYTYNESNHTMSCNVVDLADHSKSIQYYKMSSGTNPNLEEGDIVWAKASGDDFQYYSDKSLYELYMCEYVDKVKESEMTTLVSLTYEGTLTKTQYKVGDDFDPSGITVYAIFSDDTKTNVTSQISWSKVKENGTVVGTYQDKTLTISNLTIISGGDETDIVPEEVVIDLGGKTKFEQGSDIALSALVTPLDANKDIVWTSSNEEVVKIIDNSIARAVGVGKAVIVATSSLDASVKASLEIEIVEVGSLLSESAQIPVWGIILLIVGFALVAGAIIFVTIYVLKRNKKLS